MTIPGKRLSREEFERVRNGSTDEDKDALYAHMASNESPYEMVALTDLDDGPVEEVVFVEAPEDDLPAVPERLVDLALDAIGEESDFDTVDQAVEAVLRPVLADLQQQVMALKPYEDGRISKGLVLAILRGEIDG